MSIAKKREKHITLSTFRKKNTRTFIRRSRVHPSGTGGAGGWDVGDELSICINILGQKCIFILFICIERIPALMTIINNKYRLFFFYKKV